MNKQQREVLAILKAYGNEGMNSYEWRMKYIQLPARIKELKKMGHLITTRQRKNRSVDYILISEAKEKTNKPITRRFEWVFEGNSARQVEVTA